MEQSAWPVANRLRMCVCVCVSTIQAIRLCGGWSKVFLEMFPSYHVFDKSAAVKFSECRTHINSYLSSNTREHGILLFDPPKLKPNPKPKPNQIKLKKFIDHCTTCCTNVYSLHPGTYGMEINDRKMANN